MSVTIYHNPNDPTSCDVLQELLHKGLNPIVIDVMQDAPTKSELIGLLNSTGFAPWDIIHPHEAQQMGLRKEMRDITKLLTLMAQNPKLIQHPIVVADGRGKVCRSTDAVADLF